MKLLPLGSVLRIKDKKVCIIGYTSVEEEATSIMGYVVVSYPLGFINIDKTFFIPLNLEYEILAEGYITKPYEKLLDTIGKGFEMLSTKEALK